jgi:hypothetical protein
MRRVCKIVGRLSRRVPHQILAFVLGFVDAFQDIDNADTRVSVCRECASGL